MRHGHAHARRVAARRVGEIECVPVEHLGLPGKTALENKSAHRPLLFAALGNGYEWKLEQVIGRE